MADSAVAIADEFAAWLSSQGRSANTVAAYRRDVTAYLRWCASPAAAHDSPLAAYVAEVRASRKASTAARAVVALRVFHRWRGDGGDESQLPELAGVPIPVAEPPLLAVGAIDALFAAAEGESVQRRRDRVALGLLYFGGLKASEAISLDVVDIDANATVITVDRDGPHQRFVPVVPRLRAGLQRWLEPTGRDRLAPATGAVLVNSRGQRLTRQGLWLLCSAVGKRGGLGQVSPNDLRRACGEHLAARGVAATAVGSFLGHARGDMPTLGMLTDAGWGEL